jgi:23S rRNA (cytidine2498-2'-O)-methyltransferase
MTGGFPPLPGRVFHTICGFEDHLEKELGPPGERWGPLFYYPGCSASYPGQSQNTAAFEPFNENGGKVPETPEPRSFWHQNVWLNPVRIEFDSIGGAAKALRSIQRNWHPEFFTLFRRGRLIAEKLPPIAVRPHPFPWELPAASMGAFTLLDEKTIVAAADCTSPFPGGVIEFEEDKMGPPSRAYLKCWEALTLLRRRPAPGERCLDAGASPGGWTWALARLGAEVIAVDRAPLEERAAALPGVSFIKHDAFTLKPEDLGPLDWLFCDAACYPPRLYEWIGKWLASGLCKNFVCTLKMQGNVNGAGSTLDFDSPRHFAAIPGGRVVHLYHNKHELTWLKTVSSSQGS